MNKQHLRTLLVCFLFCGSWQANAQKIPHQPFDKVYFANKKEAYQRAIKALKMAEGLIEIDKDYKNAIKYYLKAHQINPYDAQLNYKIGKAYMQLPVPELAQAVDYLEQAYRLEPLFTPQILFDLACAYQLSGEWNKALEIFEEYKQLINKELSEKEQKNLEKRIAESQSGKQLAKTPVRILQHNLGNKINSKEADFGAVLDSAESSIYFTSTRGGTTGFSQDTDFQYYEDIYMIQKNKMGEWGRLVQLPMPINSAGHDAVTGISYSGKSLLIFKGSRNGDLFLTKFKGKQMDKPLPLPDVINSDAKETSGSFAPDNSIYFTSDRAGGAGGLDLYVSRYDGKQWLAAENLGNEINTPYDEEGAFVSADGKTLYFCSRGHNTIGGYDLFKSEWKNGKWAKPENMGIPINTPFDDAYPFVSRDKKRLYYTSTQATTNGLSDIYMVTLLGDEKRPALVIDGATAQRPTSDRKVERALSLYTSDITLFRGQVKDSLTGKPVPAFVSLIDHESNKLIAKLVADRKNGEFLLTIPSGRSYGLSVEAKGYLFYSLNISTLNLKNRNIQKQVMLTTVSTGNKMVLNNIFFDSDKASLREASTAELQNVVRLMQEYPKIRVEISGHTDNTGSDTRNNELSGLRARAVVNYLVSNGVDRRRLEFKGYGKSRPIASNDTEAGKQLNRRTEFKVLSE